MEPDKSQKNRSDGSTVPSDQMKESPVSNNLLHPHSAENQGHRGSSGRISMPSNASDTAQSIIASIRKDMDCLQGRIHSLESTVSPKPNHINGPLSEFSRTAAQSNHVHPTSLEFSETIRNTIEKMTREMENLQRRMASLENRRQPEASSSRKKIGSARWGLSLQATTVILAWPIIVLLLSRWFSNRRRR